MKTLTERRPQLRLTLIKMVHTLIWLVMSTIVIYVLWSGVSGNITAFSWVSVLVIVAEAGILALFGGSCPLTVMARKYSRSQKANFDICLPEVLARYNKLIFGSMFLVGLLLMCIKSF